MPIAAGNDANLAALGECWQGCGAGFEDFVLITLGTGIGRGVVMGGKLLIGANGADAEIGHLFLSEMKRVLKP
ncbi:MAG: ROK family protein [Flexilinea sp.]|nr:ROK family protein [Flexilinea sp.]